MDKPAKTFMPKREFLDRSWSVLVSGTATIAAVVLPLHLVFMGETPVNTVLTDLIITVVFGLDVLFALLGTRREADTGRDRPSASGSAFRKNAWLLIDVLSALPFSLLFGLPVLHLLRLLKLLRVAQFMRLWRHAAVQISNILRLLFFAYWLFLSAHWIACGWLVLRGEIETSDNFTSYVSALYWSIQTLSTVGYGDVTPVNNPEKIFVIFVMLLGVGAYGYIIGNVATILANMDPAKTDHLSKMEKLNAFMDYRDIPAHLKKRIRAYFNYLWETGLSYKESDVISSLPPALRTEVSLYLKRDIIERVPMFRGAREEFIRELALRITPVVFMPGDYVYRAGETGRDMYFISRGTLQAVSPDGSAVLTTLSDGNFFGEISLVMEQPRTASVRAVTYCDLYRLDKEMFDLVLASYPEIASQIESKAKERRDRHDLPPASAEQGVGDPT